MPLSEHEQRMLEQLERQLHAEDPRLATQLADTRRPGVPVRRLVLGAALAVAGLLVVLWGVSAHLIPVGVLGTAMLAAGIFVATTGGSSTATDATGDSGARPAAGPGPDGGPRAPQRPRGEFMNRLEQRWDERRSREP